MLDCGFKYLTVKQRKSYKTFEKIPLKIGIYTKDYSTLKGDFKVGLVFVSSDPNTSLPLAYVLNRPTDLEDVLLAHINIGGYLCYVEELEAEWNPNDLLGLYQAVDEQIQKTLDISILSLTNGVVDQAELEGEFVSYWKPETNTYTLSNFDDLHGKSAYLTYCSIDSSATSSSESILYGSAELEVYKTWRTQRNLSENTSVKVNTFVLKVRPKKISGTHWPPKDANQFFEWLTVVDHNAKASLVRYFVDHPHKNHLIFLDVEKQDTFGIVLELNQTAVQLNTYANHRKTGKGGRKVDLNRASSVLMGKYAFNKFKRISFYKADKETILTRNRTRPEVGNLSTKKIALIGCGTVGGYVAELLIRSGAGMGNKSFKLFDFDTYGPHNFSRHTLNSSDFGKNKAIALKRRLEQATHLKLNIEAKNVDFTFDADHMSTYDIIIDATGRGPISKRLAYLLRQITCPKKPIIIHGLNYAGIASMVFIDYSDGCYNCFFGDKSVFIDGVYDRLKNHNNKNPKKISCGNTYTPYDAAVSVMTAALIQEAVLSTLEHERDWNYKEHIFVDERTKKPAWIKSRSLCDICNDR